MIVASFCLAETIELPLEFELRKDRGTMLCQPIVLDLDTISLQKWLRFLDDQFPVIKQLVVLQPVGIRLFPECLNQEIGVVEDRKLALLLGIQKRPVASVIERYKDVCVCHASAVDKFRMLFRGKKRSLAATRPPACIPGLENGIDNLKSRYRTQQGIHVAAHV